MYDVRRGVNTPWSCDQDDVRARGERDVSCRLAQQPFRAIPRDRVPDPLGGDHRHTSWASRLRPARPHVEHDESAGALTPTSEHLGDVATASQPVVLHRNHRSGREFRPAPTAPVLDDRPSCTGVHAGSEPVLAGTTAVVGLEGALHDEALPGVDGCTRHDRGDAARDSRTAGHSRSRPWRCHGIDGATVIVAARADPRERYRCERTGGGYPCRTQRGNRAGLRARGEIRLHRARTPVYGPAVRGCRSTRPSGTFGWSRCPG